MSQLTRYLIVAIVCIIIAIIGTIAVRYKLDHPDFLSTPNYKPYQDSILAFKNNIKIIQFKEDSLAKVDSSLQVIKNQITKQYYEKVKHISVANTQQLDSIITVELRHN